MNWDWKPQPRSEPPKPAPGASQAQLKAIWEAYPDHFSVQMGDPRCRYQEEFYSQEFPHIRTLVSSNKPIQGLIQEALTCNKPIQGLIQEALTYKGALDGFARVKDKTVQCQGNTKNGKRCRRKVHPIDASKWSGDEEYPFWFDNCATHQKDE